MAYSCSSSLGYETTSKQRDLPRRKPGKHTYETFQVSVQTGISTGRSLYFWRCRTGPRQGSSSDQVLRLLPVAEHV